MAESTPEELVAKAIAPVKKEFLRPPPSRTNQNETAASDADADANAKWTVVSKEKKSRRQMKRERREKSVQHLCPEIAKSQDVNSCRYGDKCRFSHDLEAFKAQKPPDLEGKCPFMDGDEPCPYGLACRFYGTHEDSVAVAGNGESVQKKGFEINGLKKDVQKLLWKNKMRFPKADAKLKCLGLMGPGNSRVKRRDDEGADQTLANGSHVTAENGCEVVNDLSDKSKCSSEMPIEDNAADGMTSDETRPLKKKKSVEEKCCHSGEANELSVPGKHAENSSEPEVEQCTSEVPIEDNAANGITTDETGPLKQTKSVEEKCCTGKEANELSVLEKGGGNSSIPELEVVADGAFTETDASLKTHPREKKLFDFRGKLYLAPLTTVGNLPFRRVCKVLGADVTCGEMAMCTNLLQGQASEWALLRRHSSEDLFGVQICGAYPDTVARTVELIDKECMVDFIDINMGCPIDIVVNKGAGSSLLTKPMRMKNVIEAASGTVDRPITVKVRTGFFEGKNRIDSLIADIGNWGANAVTVHGRTRQQRYSKLADWDYIYQCARKAPESLQVLGNGDIFSYTDWNNHKSDCPDLSSSMIARGALIKPWIFTEIKEQRHWDITSGERLDILKDYVHFGLEHWGSDAKGVETTRNFLLEWLSYTCRYIPVGLLDVIPQRINWRPPSYFGRDELETLMASDSAADWIRISEMLLGKVPDGFTFAPKHKSNAYDRAENG